MIAHKFFFFLIALFGTLSAQAGDGIGLLQATKSGMVSVVAKGKGGHFGKNLTLRISNKTNKKISLQVEAGTIFNSEREWEQDLVVLEEALLVLQAQASDVLDVRVACIQPSNASPANGAAFLLGSLAEGGLLKVVSLVNRLKCQEDAVQTAVWAAIQKTETSLYGTDTTALRQLCATLTETTGKPCNVNKTTPAKPVVLTYINTSLQCLVPDYLTDASLKLYDHSGNLLRTYHEGKPQKPGFYQFRVGYNHTNEDTLSFWLKLENQGKVIAKKLVRKNDTIPQLWEKRKETYITYNLTNDVAKGRIGVYDANDNLYVLIADNYPLKKGMHRTEIKFYQPLPHGVSFFVKVKENGKTVAEQNIPLDQQDSPKYAPITMRGTFSCSLQTTIAKGKLAAYDEAGNVVWVVYEDSKFAAGKKQLPYVVQHRLGKDATIYLRLTDEAGTVVCEQKL